MIPLVDMHCHLLAGVDDGPPSEDEALAMCRLSYEEGVRLIAATAHQSDRWPNVTPEIIRQGCARLAQRLREERIPLAVFPCAEVAVRPEIESQWQEGKILTVADRGKYVLLEMPNHVFFDIGNLVLALREIGIRPILAHPERHPELLHEVGLVESLVDRGCLIQVSSGSITKPRNSRDERALQAWLRRGIVHLVGSDGHSISKRPPHMAQAYQQVKRWAGVEIADRIFSTNSTAIAYGLPVQIVRPQSKARRWLARLW